MGREIPCLPASTKYQIMTETSMTKILRKHFGDLDIGNWDLFGIWNLINQIQSTERIVEDENEIEHREDT